jgi:hypothetical protein
MSGWTVAQVSSFPSCLIEQPVEGEVKLALEVKENDKGPSQFFVLKDPTGEIGVSYYAADKDGRGFSAVKVGDKVRIQATMGGKGKLAGASKAQYEKDGKTVPKLTVYGDRLTNLSRSPEPHSSPVQTVQGATLPPGLSPSPISEIEAVEVYWRVFERQAAKLSRFMAVEDFEGFMSAAGDEMLQICHGATAEVFRGILTGRVTPDNRREAPKPQAQQQSQPRHDDPFEGLDEDDIPFNFLLPFLLPLFYFATYGGLA